MTRPRLLLRLLVLTAGVTTSACLDNKCDQITDEPALYTDGHTNASGTLYQSSTPGTPLLRFPAGRIFNMEHGLRSAPVDYAVRVSFNQMGTPESEAAGDQAWVTVTPKYISVRNKTCADFFVRVVAWTDPADALESPNDAPWDAGETNGEPGFSDAGETRDDASVD